MQTFCLGRRLMCPTTGAWMNGSSTATLQDQIRPIWQRPAISLMKILFKEFFYFFKKKKKKSVNIGSSFKKDLRTFFFNFFSRVSICFFNIFIAIGRNWVNWFSWRQSNTFSVGSMDVERLPGLLLLVPPVVSRWRWRSFWGKIVLTWILWIGLGFKLFLQNCDFRVFKC